MFELADRLVGIYKTENATKSVAINPGQFAVGAAVPAPAAAAAAAPKCAVADGAMLDQEQRAPEMATA